MAIAGLIIGALAAALFGHGLQAMIEGAVVGCAAGIVVAEWRKARRRRVAFDPLALVDARVAERIRAMEKRIADLERAVREVAPVTREHGVPPAIEEVAADATLSHDSPVSSCDFYDRCSQN